MQLANQGREYHKKQKCSAPARPNHLEQTLAVVFSNRNTVGVRTRTFYRFPILFADGWCYLGSEGLVAAGWVVDANKPRSRIPTTEAAT